ncbi:hypothetical protein MPSEU_000709900 [Mayamaea pseudoterrestris]|nr:hypothetical protein MPSEU_000709900 [Mayamaea pseudoterrestris]
MNASKNAVATSRTTSATGAVYSKTNTEEALAFVPVFYNLFAANKSDSRRVKRLVNRQLSIRLPEHQVFLHSIGYPIHIANTTLLQHHNEGNEVLTLHSLWEYCKIQPDARVVYLHSKGSFHPKVENDLLRGFLTAGALSKECLHLPDACNVCSSRMSPIPHPHTPGNMWLARCRYVRQLIDPLLFEAKMRTVSSIPKHTKTEASYGLGRYSAEHWVHSHPSCKPCDLSDDSKYRWAYHNVPSSKFTKKLSMAPRFNRSVFAPQRPPRRWIKNGKNRTSLPVVQIGLSVNDRIVEYQELYNESPAKDWWGWQFYSLEEAVL